MTATSGADTRPDPGQRVLGGRYQLGRRIGAGGMATILRADDPPMERQVAIKVLHRHLADDPEVRTRFKAEARHAASLSHPNIVAVYDQGEADLPYIVMELIDGPSLREVLAAHGPMSPEEMLAVIVPLCGALTSAHAQGLVHRDVKPENVLVTTDGTPKLADFGIARVMAATSHTATGTLVGSVHYLAPELVGGIEATPASDQYAVGVMVYELLTGRKPLPAETPMAIALRHASEDVPRPSRYAPEVSAALDDVVARATSRQPSERYPSMEELAAALTAAVPDGPAPVTTVTDDGSLHTLILPPADQATQALSHEAIDGHRAAREDLARRREPDRPRGRGARDEVRRPRRTRRLAVVLTTLLLVLGLLAGGGYAYWDQVVAPVAVIPDLVGMDRREAEAVLRDLDLSLEIESEQHRLTEPAGEVLGQRPARGEELRAGAIVEVVLSRGPQIVDMPDMLGRPYEDFLTVLEANVFSVDLSREHSDTVPAGHVMGQSPEPDARVPQGTDVSVTVSLGIEQVTVPTMVGRTQEDAEAAAAQARLGRVTVTEEYSDEVPQRGIVISQSLPADTEVDKGSDVALVVSRGPLTVSTPDVGGMDVDEARAAIEALGLTVTPVTEPQPTLGPFTIAPANRVQGQVPAAGTAIRRGEAVEIYYYTPR